MLRNRKPRLETSPENASEELKAAYEAAVPPPYKLPTLYSMIGQNEAVFRAFSNKPLLSENGLMHTGQLSWRDRELTILRVTGRTGAAHEWGVHVRYYKKASQMTEDEIQDTVRKNVDKTLWSERDLRIIELVDSLLQSNDVSDELWERISQEISDQDAVEIVCTAGLYTMISWGVVAFGAPEEQGCTPFPWDQWEK